MITIVTAGGIAVDLATREIAGVHYAEQAQYQWHAPIQIFDLQARAYGDSSETSVRLYAPSITELPGIPLYGIRYQAVITDWTNPGTDDGDWSGLRLGFDSSLDGINWEDDGYIDVAAGGNGIEAPLPLVVSTNVNDVSRYMRFYYTASTTSPTWATDTVTFSASLAWR